jgi:DNA repair protein RadD
MIPRPHQIKALDMIWRALGCDPNVLLSAACSAGKTFMFSKITKRFLGDRPAGRVLILLDMEVLVTQARDKLIEAVPELQLDIGIACASVSAFKDTSKRVTIASRQSLANILGSCEPFQLMIVDECHMMAMPKEEAVEPVDQYAIIIQVLRDYNPKMRMLGVTATPFRLNDGYIYGNKNASGSRPYFSEVHHRITVAELTAAGYLAPLVGVTACPEDLVQQLGEIGMIGGEYNLGRLGALMEQGVHVGSAVEAWREHAIARKKTLAFCVTIEHAERLAEGFSAAGIPATAIHSRLTPLENHARMKDLEKGLESKVFCSVAKLTKGLDVIDIDCILMARPTKSTALYAQMLGRGQRIAPGKTDCIVIDMVGNNAEHGTDLDKLKVTYKRGVGDEEGQMPTKECPKCACLLHPAVRVCPECQYEYPEKDFEELDKPHLVHSDYGVAEPIRAKVQSMYVIDHLARRKSGEKEEDRRTLLKIELSCYQDGYALTAIDVKIWLCFPDDGYSGFAIEKGEAKWLEMCGTRPPRSAAEALDRQEEIKMPEEALIDVSGKWPELLQVFYEVDPAPLDVVEKALKDNEGFDIRDVDLSGIDLEEIPF